MAWNGDAPPPLPPPPRGPRRWRAGLVVGLLVVVAVVVGKAMASQGTTTEDAARQNAMDAYNEVAKRLETAIAIPVAGLQGGHLTDPEVVSTIQGMGPAFDTFSSDLSDISWPSDTQADADQLIRSAQRVAVLCEGVSLSSAVGTFDQLTSAFADQRADERILAKDLNGTLATLPPLPSP